MDAGAPILLVEDDEDDRERAMARDIAPYWLVLNQPPPAIKRGPR